MTDRFSPETKEALDKSIEHWQRLTEVENIEQLFDEDVGAPSCALCNLFLKVFLGPTRWSDERSCEGCPVAEFTGEKGCSGTPYESAENIYQDIGHDFCENEEDYDLTKFTVSERFTQAAKAEVKFLKKVRAWTQIKHY